MLIDLPSKSKPMPTYLKLPGSAVAAPPTADSAEPAAELVAPSTEIPPASALPAIPTALALPCSPPSTPPMDVFNAFAAATADSAMAFCASITSILAVISRSRILCCSANSSRRCRVAAKLWRSSSFLEASVVLLYSSCAFAYFFSESLTALALDSRLDFRRLTSLVPDVNSSVRSSAAFSAYSREAPKSRALIESRSKRLKSSSTIAEFWSAMSNF